MQLILIEKVSEHMQMNVRKLNLYEQQRLALVAFYVKILYISVKYSSKHL